jgi:branched-chain amino acid aminotransferase
MTMNERVVYLGGEYRSWDEANVHIMSHSFGRGSAIFEVLSFSDTPAGPAVFRLDEHVSRFFRSASLLGMEPPLPPGELQEAVLQTVKLSALKAGLIKVFGFYPEISSGVLPPPGPFRVAVLAFSREEALGGKGESASGTVTACVSQWRRLDPQTVPIEAKVAANYVNGMVARAEAQKKGCDYAVLLDTQGFLAEGATESLFLVKEGRLMTPSLGTVLQSITRKSLLAVAETMGLETVAGRLSPVLLDEAEELFLSSTSARVAPIRQIDRRILSRAPGEVTQRLAERIEAITAGRDERFRGWLFPAV